MTDGGLTVIDGETGEVTDFAAPLRKLTLELPDTLSFEGWCAKGRGLGAMERGVQWLVGDWWAFGSQKYGERASAAAQGIFGRAFQTLANYASIARQFETSRRREVLSFMHHAEVAALPAPVADALLDKAETEGWSARALRQQVSQHKVKSALGTPDERETCKSTDLFALAASGRRFGTIYADPPWLYDNQGTRAATGNHYGGLTVDELCALPVGELVLPDAHLHLWTTNAFLFECPKIFDAWGFEFRSSFVWVKSQMGIGNYWRNSHEILLTAIRGNAKRFADHSIMSWMECARGNHSGKPEQVRGYIERASPGPYLELFGRSTARGWAVWGDGVESSLLHGAVEEIAA